MIQFSKNPIQILFCKKSLLAVCICLWAEFAQGQSTPEEFYNKGMSGYQRALKSANDDSLHRFALLLCVYHSNMGNVDSGNYYYHLAEKIAQKPGAEKQLMMKCLEIKENIVFSANNYGDLMAFYREAMDYAKKHDFEAKYMQFKVGLATLIFQMGDAKKAIDLLFEAQKAKVHLETDTRLNIYETLGHIHESQKEYSKSIYYYKKYIETSYEYKTEITRNHSIATAKANLGFIYQIVNNDSALLMLQESYELFKQVGNQGGQYTVYAGVLLEKAKRASDKKAIEKEIFKLEGEAEPIQEEVINGNYCILMMRAFFEVGNNAKTDYYKELAEKLLEREGNIFGKIEMYETYHKSLFANNRFREAYIAYDSLFKINDRYLSDKQKNILLENEANLNYEKKAAIEKAEYERQQAINKLIIIIVILILLIVSIFSYFIFRSRKALGIEKVKSDNLLLNILPKSVAEELKEKGKVQSELYKNVTVLFTDFKDFTKVSEQLTPQELVAEIDYNFREFDRIISKYNIEKIKTIGDAYVCAAGVPNPNPNHAQEIIHAAIEIVQFVNNRKKERDLKGLPSFGIRIGAHTGEIVAGVVGSKKFAFDIWGDAVNTAARMEQNSDEGKINISGQLYELIKDEFNCVHRGKIIAKNKGELDMYFIEL
ncbi:MAG: adenylate/guanylate cyclase domain-containing protein [Chitinophagales bacterium]|nr:adenylate/guanylate cyclase domain-containing protein [Chitinophagales bacterium]